MLKALQILTFFLALKIYLGHTHNCIHSKIIKRLGGPVMENPRKIKVDTEKSRRLSETWHKIKIKTDFSNISNVSSETQNYIKSMIIPELVKRFELLIQVKGDSTIPGFSSKTCQSEIKVPTSYASPSSGVDLILFIKIESSSDNYIAWAFPCQIERQTNRPNVGVISINEKYLDIDKSQIQKFVKVLLHEAIHILAISPSLYDKIPTATPAYEQVTVNSNLGENKIFRLTTPKLLQAAKNHFGCSSMVGVNLENEGSNSSAGAHFEKVHYGNELMNPQEVGMPSLSVITLSFMEDTTWYKINYNYAESYYWGKNKGCDFINNTSCATKFDEFCTVEKEISCTGDYKGKTFCDQIKFGDNCFLAEPIHSYECSNTETFVKTSLHEKSGKYSRCMKTIKSAKLSAGCYETICKNGFPVIKINGAENKCEAKGQQIKIDGDFSVLCPDPQDFCKEQDNNCSEDCNGNGRCHVSNGCFCDYFFDGNLCSNSKSCNGSNICQTIKDRETSTNSISDDILDFNDIFDFFGFNPLRFAFGNLFMTILTIFVN